MLARLDQVASDIGDTSWFVIVAMLVYFFVFIAVLLFLELKSMRNLESLIKVFFGFDHPSCREMKKKCQKLISKIQQTHLDNEDELFAATEADHQPAHAKATLQKQQADDGLGFRKRRTKGTLGSFCTLKPVAAVFYFVCSFGFKLYSEIGNRQTLEESAFIYGAGLDVSRLRHESLAVRAWVERSALAAPSSKESALSSADDLIATWTRYQKVDLSSIVLRDSPV